MGSWRLLTEAQGKRRKLEESRFEARVEIIMYS